MKIVFPVRFAAHGGMAVQTTSLEMTDSGVRVLSPFHRPQPDELLTLQLYLPDAQPPAGAIGRMRGRNEAADSFWLDVVDAVRGVGARVEALASLVGARLNRPTQQQEGYSPHRALPRYPVSLGVSIEAAKRLITANACNMSASGLFVRTGEEVEVGSVVSLWLELPDRDKPVAAQAKVVHSTAGGRSAMPWSEPGLGLQFIDGDDAFRARIDRHLARLAKRSR